MSVPLSEELYELYPDALAPAKELASKYPGCYNAVLVHEWPGAKCVWNMVFASACSPEEIVDRLRESARMAIGTVPNGPLNLALPEMSRPDFLRYVRDKVAQHRAFTNN